MDDCTFRIVERRSLLRLTLFAALVGLFLTPIDALAQSKWIWTPKQDPGNANYSDCFFRKKFSLVRPENSELFIVAGDKYELYINGELVSKRDSYGTAQKLDVTDFLLPGVNLVAAKVAHFEGQEVGFAMRLRVLEKGEKAWRHLKTDKTWKTRQRSQPQWFSTSFNDLGWLPAKELKLATTIGSVGQVATSRTPKTAPTPKSVPAQTTAPAQRATLSQAASSSSKPQPTVDPKVKTGLPPIKQISSIKPNSGSVPNGTPVEKKSGVVKAGAEIHIASQVYD